MESLIDALIRYYGARPRDIVTSEGTAGKSAEARLLDLANHDASTFPYLP